MGKPKSIQILRIVIMLLLVLVIMPLLPMLVSGRWGWWQAWLLAILFFLTFIVSRAIARRKTPDILKERVNYNLQNNTQSWDKWLSPVVAFGNIFVLLVAGLDARFHWSAGFSLPVEIVGVLLVLAGYLLGSYAFVENSFFSGTVRIQEERGHRVISSGPYAWIRHPGYLGSLVSSVGVPLLLGSAWAFIPVVIFGIFFIIRTHLEDRFLQANLPGYQEYSQKVRYRLFPGVW